MTVAPPPTPSAPFPPAHAIRRFTVDEYHALIKAGVLKERERIELLEGWIVEKMTHNPLHDVIVDRVQEAIRDRVARDWRVRVQSATTTADSEPEPDVVVARGPAERYLQRHPGAADIALLVEVADTSLTRDRHKARIYAREGIAVYWIINLQDSVVEVYTDPTGPADPEPRYRRADRYTMADAVPLAIPGQSPTNIAAKELLPS
jgi:Uma2 family endonuclease